MKEEIITILTKELFELLVIKKVSVLKARTLLDAIYHVAWYKNQVRLAKTPEQTAIARKSLDRARDLLSLCLVQLSFCTIDKQQIINLSELIDVD